MQAANGKAEDAAEAQDSATEASMASAEANMIQNALGSAQKGRMDEQGASEQERKTRDSLQQETSKETSLLHSTTTQTQTARELTPQEQQQLQMEQEQRESQWNMGNYSEMRFGGNNYPALVYATTDGGGDERDVIVNQFQTTDKRIRDQVTADQSWIKRTHDQSKAKHAANPSKITPIHAYTRTTLDETDELFKTRVLTYDYKIETEGKAFKGYYDKERGYFKKAFVDTNKKPQNTMMSLLKKQDTDANIRLGKMYIAMATSFSKRYEEQNSKYLMAAAKLAPVWDGKMKKLGDEIADAELELELAEMESETAEEKVEILIEGDDGGLETMIESAQEPFEEFWELVDEGVEEFAERGEELIEDKLEGLGDEKDVLEDKLENAADVAEQSWDQQATTAIDQKQRYVIASRKKMKDVKLAVSGAARQADTTAVQMTNLAGIIRDISGISAEYQRRFEELIAQGEGLARNSVSAKIVAQSDTLNTKLDGERMKPVTEVKKQFNAVAAVVARAITESDSKMDSYLAQTTSNIQATSSKFSQSTTQVKNVEKEIPAKEKSMQNMDTFPQQIVETQGGVDEIAGQLSGAALDAQQSTWQAVGEMSKGFLDSVGKEHKVAQDALESAATALLSGIYQKSGDQVHEVNVFAQRGIDETNAAKQSMVLTEAAMQEAELRLSQLFARMKEIALTANMTATNIIQGAQDGVAASMAMEKDLNTTAMENFAALTEDVKAIHKEMVDQAEQRIASTVGQVSTKVGELMERLAEARSQIEAYKEKRSEYESDTQMKVTNLDVELKQYSDAASRLTRKTLADIDAAMSGAYHEGEAIQGRQKDETDKMKARVQENFGRLESRLLDVVSGLGEQTSQATSKMAHVLDGQKDDLESAVAIAETRISGSLMAATKAADDAKSVIKGLKDDTENTASAEAVEEALDATKNTEGVLHEVQEAGAKMSANDKKYAAEISDIVKKKQKDTYKSQWAMASDVEGKAKYEKDRETEAATQAGEQMKEQGQQVKELTDEMIEKVMGEQQAVGYEAHNIQNKEKAASRMVEQQALEVEKRVNEEVSAVGKSGGDAEMEQELQSQKVAVLDRKIQRETETADGQAKQLETEAKAVIHSVDTAGMEEVEDAKINRLHARMESFLSDLKDDTAEAEDSIEAITYQTQRAVESKTQRIRKLNQDINKLGLNNSKLMDPLHAMVNGDEAWARSALQDLHDLGLSLSKHVGDRREVLNILHKTNKDDIARATAMSALAGADELERVLTELDTAMQQESNLSWSIENEMKPQANHWRQGIAEVFEHLGLALDLDAIEADAKKRMKEGQSLREELAAMNNALDDMVRGQGKNVQTKLGVLSHKQRELVREALHNADLSTQDRLSLIKQIKATFAREAEQYVGKLRQLQENQIQFDVDTQEKVENLKTTLKRAEMSMKQWARGVPEREDLLQRRQALAQTMKKTREGGFGGQEYSLLQTADSEVDEAGQFSAVAAGLGALEKRRDDQEASIEAGLASLGFGSHPAAASLRASAA